VKNTLIGVVSSAAIGAVLLAAATPARADANSPGYDYADNGNSGPGPYGVGGPGTGKVVAHSGYWNSDVGYGYGYGYSDNGNSGPGPYGIGGPGTGKVVQ